MQKDTQKQRARIDVFIDHNIRFQYVSNFKATPTDYKGIRFRSKSEAIFARAMDLAGITEWVYEPDSFDGYTPDFSVVVQISGWSVDPLNYLIEYKPASVSKAYLQKLENLKITDPYDSFFIFTGSAFNDDGYCTQGLIEKETVSVRVARCLAFAGPVSLKMKEAKEYRFDLAN